MKDIAVTFPEGKRVDAHYDGRTIKTDQSVRNGGDGCAPEPFDLFFVSIATCVGIYVLEFCNERKLSTEGLGVRLHAERDAKKGIFAPMHIEITLPANFPEKQRGAILKTVNICTVVKHIIASSEFDVVLLDETRRCHDKE